MRYLGGKQRIGKTIAGIVNSYMDLYSMASYCEPFCGMVGVGRYVRSKSRYLSDVHPDLILFLKAIRDGWVPPGTLTEDEYKALRHAEPSALRGFVGFGCSFGGKWFGGYARDPKNGFDFVASAKRTAATLSRDVGGSTISNHSYSESPCAGITYCDPPYADTTGYHGTGAFDHGQFWEWVRNRRGIVLVSEYTGPDWAEVIWSKPVKTAINRYAKSGDVKNNRVEKLFFVDNT